MKKLKIFCFLFFVSIFCYSQNEGEITGKVIDAVTGIGLPGAHMVIAAEGIKVMEVPTDDNGIFVFKPLKPGTYDISIMYIGYDTAVFQGLQVLARGMNYQVFEMKDGLDMDPITIHASLVDAHVPEVITTYKAVDLKHMPIEDALGAAVMAPAVLQNERSGGLFLGGSREDATLYVVDGVRVIGSLIVPLNAISSVSVITGGIPASYGDVTGGIIEITTKGYSGIF